MTRHHHLFVRTQVERPLLTTERAVHFLRQAVALAGMKVINGPHAVLGTVPDNEGVSATAILDLSSVNLHEWPSQRLIHFDLYTCGEPPSQPAFFRLFERECGIISFSAKLINRNDFFSELNG